MAQTAQPKLLLASFQEKKLQAQEEFAKRHSFAKKWLEDKGLTLDEIRAHSARLLTGATISSALLFANPNIPLLTKSNPQQFVKTIKTPQDFFRMLGEAQNQSLTEEIETEIVGNVKNLFQLDTAFTLENNRIPTYLGKMGLEQHLLRYEGDNIANHLAFQNAGMAPGRGAFGYFFAQNGKSVDQMTDEERFYIVLQTFLIPNWNSEWGNLKNWYKYRKFLVINPKQGKAVVAVLGDAGPASWTGKQFGGSPEVMAGLGFLPKQTKGETLILYLVDPENKIPLGPVSLKGDKYE